MHCAYHNGEFHFVHTCMIRPSATLLMLEPILWLAALLPPKAPIAESSGNNQGGRLPLCACMRAPIETSSLADRGCTSSDRGTSCTYAVKCESTHSLACSRLAASSLASRCCQDSKCFSSASPAWPLLDGNPNLAAGRARR